MRHNNSQAEVHYTKQEPYCDYLTVEPERPGDPEMGRDDANAECKAK